jgi:hypothetical protein
MRLTARQVLADCHVAHEMMEAETDHVRLRVQWIGALALLRLVGDVLQKVDAKIYPNIEKMIINQWELQKIEPIFREFIKGARDRAVHEYSHDLLDRDEIDILIELSNGELFSAGLDKCLFMPLIGGYRSGEDARDIYMEALEWWERQITEIEKGAG